MLWAGVQGATGGGDGIIDDGLGVGGDEWLAQMGQGANYPSFNILMHNDGESKPTIGKGRRKTRAKRRARRAATRKLSQISKVKAKCQECNCTGIGSETLLHCTCICSSFGDLSVVEWEKDEAVWLLSTEEMLHGALLPLVFHT